MLDYHRVYVEGGLYFFTVNLLQRRSNNLLVRYIDPLGNAYPQALLDVQLVRRNTIASNEFTNKVIAIDGKTLRGSHDGAQSAIHLVSAFASEAGIVLGK
jgi:hypothetical protein